jgi:glycine betaine/proline transport system substrate-binding protein
MRVKQCLEILFALLVAAAPPAQAEQPGTVRMGQIGLSFYAVTAGVVQQVLERLAHTVEVTTGSHAQIFPRLGAGEVDLLVAARLPHGHAVYWKQYGDSAEPIAVLYEGARFDWMVPTYVPETLVASVEDLARPEVPARMERRIQGTGRDSGNVRTIAEPHGLLGPASQGTLVASKAWAARAPSRTLAVLGRMRLGREAVAEMGHMVNVQSMSPRAAAQAWVDANSALVDTWFSGQ